MAVCTNCGTPNPDGSKFCTGCGAPLVGTEAAAAAAAAAAAVIPEAPAQPESPVPELTLNPPQPTYTPPQPDFSAPQPAYTPPQPDFSAPQAPAPVATGGLLAWAIISILLCTIPGIVALLNVLRVNKCATVEEQQRALSQARTWCIVATVLGGLNLIYTIVTGGGAAAKLLG